MLGTQLDKREERRLEVLEAGYPDPSAIEGASVAECMKATIFYQGGKKKLVYELDLKRTLFGHIQAMLIELGELPASQSSSSSSSSPSSSPLVPNAWTSTGSLPLTGLALRPRGGETAGQRATMVASAQSRWSTAVTVVPPNAEELGLLDLTTGQWLLEQDLMEPHLLPNELHLRLLPPFEVEQMIQAMTYEVSLASQELDTARNVLFEAQKHLGDSSWFAAEFAARGGLPLLQRLVGVTSRKTQEYAMCALARLINHGFGREDFSIELADALFNELSSMSAARLLGLKSSLTTLAILAEEEETELATAIDTEIGRRGILAKMVTIFIDCEEVGVHTAGVRLLNALIRLRSCNPATETALGSRRSFFRTLVDLDVYTAVCNLIFASGEAELRAVLTHFQTLYFSSMIPEPYSTDNPVHEATLLRLWDASFPDTPLPGRVDPIWNHLGFQSDDPARDFRGMGVEGLYHLLYYAEQHPTSYQSIVGRLKNQLAEVGSPGSRWYPFAITGISISQMLYTLLGIPLSHQAYQDPQLKYVQSFGAPQSIVFSDPHFLQEIYVSTFEFFDSLWLDMNATYMKFSTVIEALRVRIVAILKSAPSIMQYRNLVKTSSADLSNDDSPSIVTTTGSGSQAGSSLPCRVAHNWLPKHGKLRHGGCYLCQAKRMLEVQECSVCQRRAHVACWNAQKLAVSTAAKIKPVEHRFVSKNFTLGTLCVPCNNSIRLEKGFSCEVCKMPVHTKCRDRVRPDCNTLMYLRDPKSTSSGSSSTTDVVAVFGVSLEDSMSKQDFMPPFLLSLTVDFLSEPAALEAQNIFVVNLPNQAIDDACQMIQSGYGFQWRTVDRPYHVLAGLIKRFLLKLPETPVPTDLAEQLCSLAASKDSPSFFDDYLAIFRRIPVKNQRLLVALGVFLHRVLASAEKNRLDLSKLSGVFAPLLLGVSSHPATQTIEFLITNHQKLRERTLVCQGLTLGWP